MKSGKLLAGLFGGAGAFIFSNAIYNYLILNKKNYPIRRALAGSGALLLLAYIMYQAESNTEAKGEAEEYKGIIIDENEVKATCHCEPICRIVCFAKGAIGALSEEQVKKYCYDRYSELKKRIKKGETVSV